MPELTDQAPAAAAAGERDQRAVRVAFVSSNGEFGGAEGLMYSILDGLDPSWVPTVVVLGEGPVADDVRARGFEAEVVRGDRRWELLHSVLPVRRAVRRSGAAVVHANSFRAAAVAVIATLWPRVPVVWLKVDCGRDGRLARAVGRFCAQVVGISDTVNETFRGRTRRRLHVVYPGMPERSIDKDAARRMVCEILGCGPEAEVIVLSARLCPPKGQQDLIEIAPRVLAERPDARIVLLGPEPSTYAGHEAFLRERARELGLESRVSFLRDRTPEIPGYEDVIRFVAGCDLLVAPSKLEPESGWKEGFGLAPVEAMWVGTPVVATEHGSFPEVLGEHACFVPEGDRDALARAIVEVLSDDARRERMIRGGQEWVRSRYRLADMVSAMKDRYVEAAASR